MGGRLVSGGSGVSLGGVGGFVSVEQLGIGLVGRRSPNSKVVPRVVCDWGKKVVWASTIWHTPRMAGLRMSCTRPMSRTCALSSALVIRTSSNGQLAGVRWCASPSDWLCVGTNRM